MTGRHNHRVALHAFVWLLSIVCLLQTGCVRRRLMIRSNPPDAMVYVDNQPIGKTPCATDFTYYGTREIRLVKAGYETLTVNQPIPAPWYQIAPLDFVSENLVPRKIQDYRTASFNLTPQVIVPTEQLIARGEQLRQSTLQGAVLPASATSTPAVGVSPVPPSSETIATPPTYTQPTLGQPLLVPPANVLPPESALPPGNIVPPANVLPATEQSILAPGANTLPRGGQPLETLPPPRY